MIKPCTLCLALTLPLAATPAFAQQWGGSPPAGGARSAGSSHHPAPTAQPAAAVTVDGRQPVWGGSPPAARGERAHRVVVLPYYVVPEVVAAPAPVPAPVVVDTVYAPVDASYQMQVVNTRKPPRELTTIEVYRLQPRFQKP